MFRMLAFLCLCTAATVCLGHDPSGNLPPPRYQPKSSDPAWLKQAVQLHGHLGPWVVAGVRLGMGGACAVDAKGHFETKVACEGPFEKPPQSCFLDGIQLGSGATLGKRTIQVVDAKQIVVKIQNSRTKKAVEVRPTRKLMDILEPPQKNGKEPTEEQVEQIARNVAAMPDEELFTISQP
jgi:formylmethanofuran dehydrogenase subunit E